ncbi:type 4a pilus biogenesis protein PilO [Planctomycetota bacterium]
MFKNKQQIIIIAAAILMICVFSLVWYLPLQKRKNTIEQADTIQQLSIDNSVLQNNQLPTLKEQIEQFQVSIGNYDLHIPEYRDLGTFLQEIAELMNKHGLKKQVVNPNIEIQTDDLNCIPVTMQCNGQLSQIFEFFKSLQSLDRMVRIEQVTLINDKNFNGQVSMQTKAFIYYKAPAEQG